MTWDRSGELLDIGMIQGIHRLTFQQLHDAVVHFRRFGSTMGIGFPGEASGIVLPMKRLVQARRPRLPSVTKSPSRQPRCPCLLRLRPPGI